MKYVKTLIFLLILSVFLVITSCTTSHHTISDDFSFQPDTIHYDALLLENKRNGKAIAILESSYIKIFTKKEKLEGTLEINNDSCFILGSDAYQKSFWSTNDGGYKSEVFRKGYYYNKIDTICTKDILKIKIGSNVKYIISSSLGLAQIIAGIAVKNDPTTGFILIGTGASLSGFGIWGLTANNNVFKNEKWNFDIQLKKSFERKKLNYSGRVWKVNLPD